MTEQSWKPLFRTGKSTITRALQSPAFIDSRRRAGAIIDDPVALRMLANSVESVDHTNAPLSAIADRVSAAVRFLRSRADRIDTGAGSAAATTARERLLVAALDYLVTPVDMVPDFHVGGYIDDVLVLTWAFGAAVVELDPFLPDDPPPGGP